MDDAAAHKRYRHRMKGLALALFYPFVKRTLFTLNSVASVIIHIHI